MDLYGFTYFCQVLPSFAWFYLVLPGITFDLWLSNNILSL